MRPREQVLLFVVTSIVVAACSPDATPTAYHVLSNAAGDVKESASPLAFLQAAGCRPAASRHRGVVAIPRIGGGMLLADCGGVSRRAVGRAAQAYRDVNTQTTFEMAGGGGSYWEYSQDVYVCESEPADTITMTWEATGDVLMFIDPGMQSCGMIEVWYEVYDDGDDGGATGDGGGAPSGDYFPSNITPTIPPGPTDTICKHSTADSAGALNNLSMQDSLGALLTDGRSTDTELLAFFAIDGSGGWHFLRGVLDMSHTDNCVYSGSAPSHPNLTIVASAHVHPDSDGALITCRISGNSGVVINAAAGGGGSADWAAADSTRMPVYTIDIHNIARLDPGIDDTLEQQSNPHIWQRIQGGCAAN